MASQQNRSNQPTPRELRARAEAMLRVTGADVAAMPMPDTQRLVHELQVHQIELQLQNEELHAAQVELIESRDRYAELYDFAPVGYATLDSSAKILDANLYLAVLLGVNRDKLINTRLSQRVARESQDALYLHLRAVMESNTEHACQIRMHRADGAILTMRLESIVIPSAKEHHCRTALIDVTETARAMEAITANENRLRLFIEHAPVAIAMLDRDMQYLAASDRWLKDYHLEGSVVGKSHYQVFPEIPESWKQVHRRALAGEFLSSDGDRFQRADGSVQWIRWEVLPWHTATGQVAGIVISTEDITDRKTQAEALRELNQTLEQRVTERTRVAHDREERLKAILNAAVDSIITINYDGVIQAANRATESMFGYSISELLDLPVHTIIPSPQPQDHDRFLTDYLRRSSRKVLAEGREMVGRRKDGSSLPVEFAASEIPHLQLFIGIIRDVSERQQLQKHVLEIADDEQRRIGQELHDGTGQELTGMSFFANSLREHLTKATRHESAGQTLWQLGDADFSRLKEIAGRLAEALVACNRRVHNLSHGIMPVQIDPEGLQTALEDLAVSLGGSESLKCRFVCPDKVVVSDQFTATHLYRIAQEALNNAQRHSRATQIELRLSQKNQRIVLEICDNGIGFDTDGLHATESKLSGMGLRTMNYRAGLIGGTLQIEQRPEGGISVRCSVPQPVTTSHP